MKSRSQWSDRTRVVRAGLVFCAWRSARRAVLSIVTLTVCVAETLFALTPGDLSRVRFEQHPGQQLSRDLIFRDETGRTVKLGVFFGKHPVIFVLGYYRCPMLCTMINDGLINALENLKASVGTDFDVIDLSVDPNETSAAAADKKKTYLRQYGRSGAGSGWHCLVGDKASIAQLAEQVGYRYAYDPELKQYAHPSGVVVLTPDGKISRYIFGVTFNSTELRDAIAAAKDGKSGPVLSQVFLLCYHYNPISGKYGALILSILRIASVATVFGLGGFVAYATRKRKPSPTASASPPRFRQSSPIARGSRASPARIEAAGKGVLPS